MYCALSLRQQARELSQKAVALRETGPKLLNEVMYVVGGGGVLWDRGESQCRSVGSHLELGPEK